MNRLPLTIGAALLGAALLSCDGTTDSPEEEDRHTCTLIGCDSVFVVVLDQLMALHEAELPATIHACLDGGLCETLSVDVGSGDPGGPIPDGCLTNGEAIACCAFAEGSPLINDCWAEPQEDVLIFLALPPEGQFDGATHAVSVRVEGMSGAVLLEGEKSATIAKHQPNGPDCEPTCYQGGVTY